MIMDFEFISTNDELQLEGKVVENDFRDWNTEEIRLHQYSLQTLGLAKPFSLSLTWI